MPEVSRFFGIVIKMIPRVTAVQYLGQYRLEIAFSDGVKGILDWWPRLESAKPGGVFEPLKDPAYFAKVELWEGTIRWPNDADVCPEVLYDEIVNKAGFHSDPQEVAAVMA